METAGSGRARRGEQRRRAFAGVRGGEQGQQSLLRASATEPCCSEWVLSKQTRWAEGSGREAFLSEVLEVCVVALVSTVSRASGGVFIFCRCCNRCLQNS